MGPRADAYFSAHGYRPGSVMLIQNTYENADGIDDFVRRLAGEGVPITEARYIYALINGD